MKRIIIAAVTMCLFATGIASAATIQLPSTGQTACYYGTEGTVITCAGTGQDGDKLKGTAWPTPRFIDNANGTVSDSLTGLIWLKNAYCFNTQTWTTALTLANALASGACGLTDGSTTGQWRLPNRKEMMSLVDRSKSNPALPTEHPFTSVQSDYYLTGSTRAHYTDNAWAVNMDDGNVSGYGKTVKGNVWPVRSGQ